MRPAGKWGRRAETPQGRDRRGRRNRAAGPEGPQGDTGRPGPAGPQGDTGAMGPGRSARCGRCVTVRDGPTGGDRRDGRDRHLQVRLGARRCDVERSNLSEPVARCPHDRPRTDQACDSCGRLRKRQRLQPRTTPSDRCGDRRPSCRHQQTVVRGRSPARERSVVYCGPASYQPVTWTSSMRSLPGDRLRITRSDQSPRASDAGALLLPRVRALSESARLRRRGRAPRPVPRRGGTARRGSRRQGRRSGRWSPSPC